jgi:ribosomal protein S1
MSDMTFEQMLDASFKTIHTGEVVEGTVIDVKPEEAVLNINYKSDGILTRNEYTNDPGVDLTKVLKIGDTLEVKVIKVNDGEGQVLLTYKRLAADRGSKRLEEAFESQEILKAKVSQVLEGGICVVVEEVRVFIPASLVSDTYEKDLSKYDGQEIEFVITEYNPKKRRFIGNRKVILVARKEEAQKKLLETIKEGDVIEGTIKNVTDFGVFVDLGGMDGLLHISEMSWGHVENPKKNYKAGDKLKVLIKEINENKIALSLKFSDTNPWNNAEEKYAVGTVVTGKVVRMSDFGAFVELEDGIDALLHVSQISGEHIEKPSDVLKVGDEVTAKVVDFNLDDHRVSISIKAMTAKPKAEEAKDDDDSEIASVDIDAVIAEENAKAEAEEPAPKKRTTKKKAAEEAPAEEAAEAEAPSEEA